VANGIAERRNRTLLDMIRFMMARASCIYRGNDAKAKIEGIKVFELKLNNGSYF
jgi:hypothetical protein